jgi:hypothetical protein
MMNPSLLMDLARERRRDLLLDASRRRRVVIHDDRSAADEVLLLGRSARIIDARVRARARARFSTGEWAERGAGAR